LIKRPLQEFRYAVYRWNSFRKEWQQYAYVFSMPRETLLYDVVRSIVSGSSIEYVCVEKGFTNKGEQTYEYWSGKNGDFSAYVPPLR